jgi:outer membrane protein OmpA-like peptidoglycan-associated protein
MKKFVTVLSLIGLLALAAVPALAKQSISGDRVIAQMETNSLLEKVEADSKEEDMEEAEELTEEDMEEAEELTEEDMEEAEELTEEDMEEVEELTEEDMEEAEELTEEDMEEAEELTEEDMEEAEEDSEAQARQDELNGFLQPIFFNFDRAEIRADQIEVLEQNLSLLEENSDLQILVGGHADRQGNAQYNQRLSLKRAEKVKAWLLKNGISADRITVEAYGETKPHVNTGKESDWESDRFVEITVTAEIP